MSSVQTRWWLLCEDTRHERFALELMASLHFPTRLVKVFRAPSGQGAADNWVVHQFPGVCKATTRRRPKERVALVVMVDGDKYGVTRRLQALNDVLQQAGQPVREENEPIVILVPTWSIETWFLGPEPGLTEAKSLKEHVPQVSRAQLQSAAQRVLRLAPDEPLPSLRAAAAELRRLPKAQ
jgi:hypothetical protein